MIKNLVNLLFPRCCFGCDSILLQNESILCTLCREKLPYTKQHLVFNQNKAHPKFYGKVNIEFAMCLLYFNKGGIVQKLFHQLKYNHHPEISYFLGNLYAHALKETNLLTQIDEIIVVPLHPSKQKKRGYNQVDGFAKALHEAFDIPINSNLLYKTKVSVSQTTKNRLERSNRKKEEFEVRLNPTDEGKHFLLLDDILTTGSTLEACCKKLQQIQNCKLSILCLAETV